MKDIIKLLRKVEGIYNNSPSFFKISKNKEFKYLVTNYHVHLPYLLYRIFDGEPEIIKKSKTDFKVSSSVLQLYNQHLNLKTSTYKKAIVISDNIKNAKDILYDIDSMVLNKINQDEKMEGSLAKKILNMAEFMDYKFTKDVNEYLTSSLKNPSEEKETELTQALNTLLRT